MPECSNHSFSRLKIVGKMQTTYRMFLFCFVFLSLTEVLPLLFLLVKALSSFQIETFYPQNFPQTFWVFFYNSFNLISQGISFPLCYRSMQSQQAKLLNSPAFFVLSLIVPTILTVSPFLFQFLDILVISMRIQIKLPHM